MATATRRGRGRASATSSIINAMVEIAERIQPCSVRALAYQLFNDKLIPSMSKKNTGKVSRLCTIAREEGVLPWDWIVDPTRQEEVVGTWDDPEAYARATQRDYRRNKWIGQPKYISVWSEKSTVEGTLQPVLREYEVPFQVVHGWSGATPIWDAVKANLGREQDTLILYVGDYDPSGMFMSEVDLPQRLARYSTTDPSDKEISAETVRDVLSRVRLEIRRIALTDLHTQLLGSAPRFPASDKKSDSRYRWFVRNHGEFCWELDALSPNQLRTCVEKAIVAQLDRDAWDRYVAVEKLERQVIIDTCSAWKSILQQDQK